MHIYFDLDGTLTDPYEGISKSIVYALERLGAVAPDEAALRKTIGPPLQLTFAGLVGPQRAERAIELYRERFADVGWRENVPYAGIHEALETLASAGHALFVATTKPHVYAQRIVAHFGLAPYFTAVFGSELDGTRVDKGELLAWALPQHSSGERSVMIGDREHDMIGAARNGIEAIGVAYGYGSVDELEAAGASRVLYSTRELAGAFG
jgi:phosphoglycolate phosphatase